MVKTGQGHDLVTEIVEHHRCLPQPPAGKRRPSMERIKQSHPDHVVDIELDWFTRRFWRAEERPEALVGGPEFPVWEERQIDLKRRAEEEHAIPDSTCHHVECVGGRELCINPFRPSRDNCRLICVIGELEDKVDVRPFILLPSSAGTDEGRPDGVRVDSRVRDQLVADPSRSKTSNIAPPYVRPATLRVRRFHWRVDAIAPASRKASRHSSMPDMLISSRRLSSHTARGRTHRCICAACPRRDAHARPFG